MSESPQTNKKGEQKNMAEEVTGAAVYTAGWSKEEKEEWEHCCFDFIKEKEVSK